MGDRCGCQIPGMVREPHIQADVYSMAQEADYWRRLAETRGDRYGSQEPENAYGRAPGGLGIQVHAQTHRCPQADRGQLPRRGNRDPGERLHGREEGHDTGPSGPIAGLGSVPEAQAGACGSGIDQEALCGDSQRTPDLRERREIEALWEDRPGEQDHRYPEQDKSPGLSDTPLSLPSEEDRCTDAEACGCGSICYPADTEARTRGNHQALHRRRTGSNECCDGQIDRLSGNDRNVPKKDKTDTGPARVSGFKSQCAHSFNSK